MYELQKYKGRSTRHECPVCHHKDVFARYVDTSTGGYLSPDVGRCNREDRCGYHYTPKQYFADHPEAGNPVPTYGARLSHARSGSYRSALPIRRPAEPPKQIDRIPKQYALDSLGIKSNFVYFLCSLFDMYDISSPTIERLMKEYYLGCTKDESVIYWQIDTEKRIRAGKIMQYNPSTGKRIKNQSGAVDWVHSRLKRDQVLPETWGLAQCLFGAHLLNRRPNSVVRLVESEKSAIIGSGMMPQYVWLATGGKQNLKVETCGVLRGRKVIVYPDLGAFDEWSAKIKCIAKQVGFQCVVSDILERLASDEERTEGLDIADYLIRQIRAGAPMVEVKQAFTQEEKALQHLAAQNPALIDLIAALDLVSVTTGKQLCIN